MAQAWHSVCVPLSGLDGLSLGGSHPSIAVTTNVYSWQPARPVRDARQESPLRTSPDSKVTGEGPWSAPEPE